MRAWFGVVGAGAWEWGMLSVVCGRENLTQASLCGEEGVLQERFVFEGVLEGTLEASESALLQGKQTPGLRYTWFIRDDKGPGPSWRCFGKGLTP